MKLASVGIVAGLLVGCVVPQEEAVEWKADASVHDFNRAPEAVMNAADAGPRTLASGQADIQGLLVHDAIVYWTTFKDGMVKSCALSGCSRSPTTLASGQANPRGVIVEGQTLYWINGYTAKTIMSMPLAGGTPVAVVTLPREPEMLASDSTHLYWTEGNNANGLVKRCVTADCKPQTLASGQNRPLGIAVDSASVYWLNYMGDDLIQVPLAGGTPVTLASALFNPSWITVNGPNVYWSGKGGIWSCAVGGCANKPTQLSSGGGYGIAADSTNVYFVNSDVVGAVVRVPVGGGVPSTMATGGSPTLVAIGTNAVVWANSKTIETMPK